MSLGGILGGLECIENHKQQWILSEIDFCYPVAANYLGLFVSFSLGHWLSWKISLLQLPLGNPQSLGEGTRELSSPSSSLESLARVGGVGGWGGCVPG